MSDRSVCVMGLGYIGLPTASVLATKGFSVLGVDVKPDIIDTINRGEVHIVEPDLHRLVHAAVDSGLLKASLEPQPAQTFIIAVPTPFEENQGEKKPDLSYIEGAVKAIAPHLKENNLIVLESTSPVGTTEIIAQQIAKIRSDLLDEEGRSLKLQIAHCPERVLPGKILQEIIENDRIVGGIDEASTQKAAQFYRTFVRGAVITTNSRTAEMAKLVENSFRDTNIAFANELSMLCDQLEIDVWELIQLANRHPRVNILNPGPGVGGHCLAVDPWFIVSRSPKKAQLIRQARKVNEYKPHYVVQKIKSCADRLRSPIIGCMGLSYKPNIDDLRESPALEVTRALIQAIPEAKILACEPHIRRLDGITLVSLDELLRRSDIVVGLVAHDTFRIVSRARLEGKMVIDTCGMFH
ncbi:MAG: UDP-N-acetyl-D-mannosamine dehydrogenase [Proteobacteria bacterium]|nr:UDP-N-acetyl-D-mannosamine dehydrogenase [Pseudomonadota bacterium]